MHFQAIHINGVDLTREQILASPQTCIADVPHLDEDLGKQLALFLREMFSEEETIRLYSSGSTGEPKEFIAQKKDLIASARRSCEFFSLRHAQRVLLRLPLNYIAAKMMVVRCLVAGLHLHLRPPSASLFDPSLGSMRFHFAPLVTQQASKTELQDLERIDCILLGGGFISEAVESKLRTHKGRVYASYGMTETYSHVAMRQLNSTPPEEYYTPLDGVRFRIDDEQRLIIQDSILGIHELRSTDRAEINNKGAIRLLGRSDTIINTGGIKVSAENIEQQLLTHADISAVALSYPHQALGECVALLWEGELCSGTHIEDLCQRFLSIYERPKIIVHSPTPLPRTQSGKINRPACREILKTHILSSHS